MPTDKSGPEELAARFRIAPAKAVPAKRYPRKAIKAKLRKKLEQRMAESKEN